MSVKPLFKCLCVSPRETNWVHHLRCHCNLVDGFSRVTETIQMGPKNPKINDLEGLV